MQKLKALAYNADLNEALLTLLILSFPFGSSFLSFSIGFMTIYPYLIILGLLTLMGFFRKSTPASRIEKYYLFFLLLFLMYSIAFLPFVENISYAIIDIRSITLMLMTGYVLMTQSRFLGFERWTKCVTFAIRVVFVLICSFGVYEFVSGVHFQGQSTEHMIERGVVDMSVYAPMFLWDNPNNFFVYQALLGVLVVLLERDGRKRTYTGMIVFSLSFVFSILVLSRIGQFLSVSCLVISLVVYFLEKLKADTVFFRKTLWYLVFTAGALILAYGTRDKFYGIPNERKMRLTELTPVHPELHKKYLLSQRRVDSRIVQPVNPAIPDSLKMIERNSNDERVALLKNGVEFIFQSKGIGVGPGQYRYLHDTGRIKNYAFGNNGAHFWLIELISQFGVLIFLAYAALFVWFFLAFLKFFRQDKNYGVFFFLAVFCFAAGSMLPSAFLILDINWIFTAIIVVLAAPVLSKSKPGQDV